MTLHQDDRISPTHLLLEQVLPFDDGPQKRLFLLVLQLRVGLLEVLYQVVQRLQHLLHKHGHLRGPALGDAVQGPAGEQWWDLREKKNGQIREETVCSLVGVEGASSLLDEVGEEECGVADDASGAGLFVLAALQDEPVVHVTFRVEAGLVRERDHLSLHNQCILIKATFRWALENVLRFLLTTSNF